MNLPSPGEIFDGRFLVERELGAGGFSNVYLVRNQTSGRPAALKILLPEDGGYSLETRARFVREVAVIARLTHRNTVTLYDHGESREGLLFMVFEYVPGEDLFHLLEREGQLDGPTVRAILTQVLGALAEAHEAGIIHRDIKPQNIRVCSPPGAPIEVKLLDFGIARATDHGSPSITKTGQLIGTPRYMSPEQLKERRLTPAADIYSLGMVAFELLVGSDALPGNRWSDQLERLQTGHVFTAPFVAAAGADLLDVIQRMTAVDPAQRLPNAPATLAALGYAPTPDDRPTHRLQRVSSADVTPTRPAWRAFAAVVIVVACAGALLFAPSDPDPRPVTTPSAEARGALLKGDEPTISAPAKLEVVEPSADVGTPWDATGAPILETHSAGCLEPRIPNIPRVRMVVPEKYDPTVPAPLIIWIHSNNQEDPAMVPSSQNFKRVVDAEGVVVAVPFPPSDQFDSWHPANIAVVEEVKDRVLAQYCIDPTRVYVWSSAGGGDLASRLACVPWLAGVVVSNFAEDRRARFTCPDPRPVLWIAARHSLHQAIGGGPDCLPNVGIEPFTQTIRAPFSATVERLTKERDCADNPRVTLAKDYVSCRRYACSTAVEACEVDGGLGWPGSPQPKAAKKMQQFCAEPAPEPRFDLARHAWDFFEDLREDP